MPKTKSRPVKVSTASEEVVKYLEGAVGVVEANSFEQMCLWERSQKIERSWVEIRHGFGVNVGTVQDRTVFISLNSAIVSGQKVIFLDATSELVDWKLIEAWLEKNLPDSAFDGERGRINKVNAMNFPNVLRREPAMAEG